MEFGMAPKAMISDPFTGSTLNVYGGNDFYWDKTCIFLSHWPGGGSPFPRGAANVTVGVVRTAGMSSCTVPPACALRLPTPHDALPLRLFCAFYLATCVEKRDSRRGMDSTDTRVAVLLDGGATMG
jgi:hypothetical protein